MTFSFRKLSITLAAVAALGGAVLTASPAFAQTGRYVTKSSWSSPALTPAGPAAGTDGAKMDFKPYSSSYLPASEGPLSRKNDAGIQDMIEKGFGDCDLVHAKIKENAKKSSAGKFDTAVKNADGVYPKLAEKYENGGGHRPSAEGWEGFCHLWAPAGLDPTANFIVSMDKIYADVPFGVGDLKELTTWNYPSPSSRFFGVRNYGSKTDAEALDPVDLLTIFKEYVGPGKPGVVFDIDPGTQVWNQPFYSWKTDTTKLSGADAAGAPAGGSAHRIVLSSEYGSEGSYAYRGEPYLNTLTWTMIVYTDKNGAITGSKFDDSASNSRIPDFAWVPVKKYSSPNLERLAKFQKDGVSVKDIESFCKAMQALTADDFKKDNGKALAALLEKICPALDQNRLGDYIRKTAARAGIDGSALDSALRGSEDENAG
jgi:hypothetical protein